MSSARKTSTSSGDRSNVFLRNCVIVVAIIALPDLARAEPNYLIVHGAPSNTAGNISYDYARASFSGAVNSAGTAVGYADRSSFPQGLSQGTRAVRWQALADSPVILGDLGVINSSAFTYALAINAGGTAVGQSNKYDGLGNSLGDHAVRWDPGGTAATDLGALSPGLTSVSQASALNDSGTIIGYSAKYDSHGYVGERAVMWTPGSNVPIELGNLGVSAAGFTNSYAYAINPTGTIGGIAQKYDAAGNWVGNRPVRWDASGIATELQTLGANATGVASGQVVAITAAGIALGMSAKYDASGAFLGGRAVRWEAGAATATELGNLGTTVNGVTGVFVSAINTEGTAVGSARRYDAAGKFRGDRAVRWDAGATAATELSALSTGPTGYSQSTAYSISDAGDAVGYATLLDSLGKQIGHHAVYWPAGGGNPIDLNALIDPASGWTLTDAYSISNINGYVVGIGTFDSDGAGGQVARQELFLIQVPEPAFLSIILGMIPAAAHRRRARRASYRLPGTSL